MLGNLAFYIANNNFWSELLMKKGVLKLFFNPPEHVTRERLLRG